MKGKSLVAACLIVPLAALFMLVYLGGNHGKHSVEHYGFFRPQGDDLVVRFGQHLVWLDRQGKEQKSLDLQDLNIQPAGDYDFFADGDLLVYHREWQPGFMDNLARYLRLQKRDVAPPLGADGFYRCDLNRLQCERFAADLPALKSSFRLAIDRATDIVYLADTTAFQLYKIGDTGNVLATSDKDTWRFPNQLVLVEGALWVADTNHHRLARVSTTTENFGQPENTLTVRLQGGHRWPHQITHNGYNWWVNVGDGQLSDGRIVQVDQNGEVTAEITPVGSRDPLSLVYWQDALWLTDWDMPLLERYAPDGTPLAAVQSVTLDTVTGASMADYRFHRGVSYAGLGGFIFVLAAGLGAAWTLERKETAAVLQGFTSDGLAPAVERPAKAAPDGQVFWLTNKVQEKGRLLAALLALGALLLALSVGLLLATGDEPSPELLQLTGIMALFVLSIGGFAGWMFYVIAGSRLGVIGGSLVMELKSGRRTIARDSAIRYTKTHLLADDVAIFMGNPHQRFFDRTQLNDYVFPRLKNAQKCSQWEMQKHLWRARDPQLMASLVVTVVVVGLFLVMRYGMPL